MNIDSWLNQATNILRSASVPTARLDAEILLADELQKDRSWIHANPEFTVQGSTLYRLDEQIERRAKHEPIAYIRGKQEFYGRDFIVSPDTLTPRPETETMIELLLESVNSRQSAVDSGLRVVDVGTGSGCVIISAALALSKISNANNQLLYSGLDISEPALKIARKNAKNLKAKVTFKKFNLLEDSIDDAWIVLANLPYVPDEHNINQAATHEPDFAIFGGNNGLNYYRTLFSNLSNNTKYVLTESMPQQHEELAQIAKKAGFSQTKVQDYIQVFSK